MKKNIGFWVLAITCFACNNNSTESTVPAKTDSIQFFPVSSYVKSQFKSIDSAQVTPMLVTTVNGKTDSVWLKKEEVATHLAAFNELAIYTDNLTQLYKETRFKDESVNAITFTYSPLPILPDTARLRKWDVYINPENGEVKKIFVVQQLQQDGQALTRHLTWEANKLARVTTIASLAGGSSKVIKDVKLVWFF
jgi:hypothetical protein